jgi:hypothetical protein
MATVGQETGRAQKAVERVPRGLGSESHFGELLARCAGVQKRIKISLKFFAGSQVKMLTPKQRADVGVVSEEESDDDGMVERPKRAYEPRSWKNRLRWLTQTGASRKKLPPVGRFCLILKGDTSKDMGRMGIVSRQTKCMVAIVWKDAKKWQGSGKAEAARLAHSVGRRIEGRTRCGRNALGCTTKRNVAIKRIVKQITWHGRLQPELVAEYHRLPGSSHGDRLERSQVSNEGGKQFRRLEHRLVGDKRLQ